MIIKEVSILNEHKSDVGKIALRSDNILTFIPNDSEICPNVESMKVDLEHFLIWIKETGPLPYLVDNRTLKHMGLEERLYIQSKLPLFASKVAVIVKGGLSSYFYNLMSYLNKPEIPIKSFENIEKAIVWLKK